MEKTPTTKYRVKALSLGGKGNKIFNSGDIVVEANFPVGAVPVLIEKGFLVVHEEGATASTAAPAAATADEKFDANGFDKEGFNKEGFDLGGFNRSGFDKEGFGRDGFNKEGLNRKGEKSSAADANAVDNKENMTGSTATTDNNAASGSETEGEKIPAMDDVDVKDIKADLKAAKISANFLASKITLYDLWVKHKLYIKK